MNTLMILLIAFLIKHEVADYALQTGYMQKKADSGTSWILPLALHAAVHALFTFIIVFYFKPELALALSALDFLIHFTVDRAKALISKDLAPWGAAFRIALSIDQIAHGLTGLLIIHLMGYL